MMTPSRLGASRRDGVEYAVSFRGARWAVVNVGAGVPGEVGRG